MTQTPVDRHSQGLRTIRVVAGDKNALVLRGLRELLAESSNLELVDTAVNAGSFVDLVRRSEADVGVLGWVLPQGGGGAVLKALAVTRSRTRIVIYSGDERPSLPAQVMALGAAAFCAKREPPAELVEAIRAVANGRMVFPFATAPVRGGSDGQPLTRREQELLATLAEGRTNAEMARDFGLSVNTVKFHLRNLYDKLQVRNRAEATAAHFSRGVRASSDLG